MLNAKYHTPGAHSSLATARLTLTVRLCPPSPTFIHTQGAGVAPLPVTGILCRPNLFTIYNLIPFYLYKLKVIETVFSFYFILGLFIFYSFLLEF